MGQQAVPLYVLSTSNKVKKDLQLHVYLSLILATYK